MNELEDQINRCREAQQRWAGTPISDRLKPVREFRHLLVEFTEQLTQAVHADVRRKPDELVATDLVPTASAARSLERRATSILSPRRVGDRPIWLWGCRDTIHRRPHGVVGIIGTWNYPIFLNAVPILHALTAGNGVVWKPSEYIPKTTEVFKELFHRAGYPPDLFVTLPATRESGPALLESPIDFLHFTGSESVGRAIASRLGARLIPSTLELSGCDALFVFADADATAAAQLAWYGATLNAGQTCMGTRRAFVERSALPGFLEYIRERVSTAGAMELVDQRSRNQMRELVEDAREKGAEILSSPNEDSPIVIINSEQLRGLRANRESIFAPLLTITPFDTLDEAIALHAESSQHLTASIMTNDRNRATQIAECLPVGSVIVNDVIVPTAHPGSPFGGRGASGWGVTQGAEGLLAFTVPQVVTVRSGSFRPHADAGSSALVPRGYLKLAHGRGLRERWRGLRELIRGIRGQS